MSTSLLVDALATFRLTRLVATDVIFDRWRDGLIERAYIAEDTRDEAAARWLTGEDAPGQWAEVVAADPDPPKLATLVTCPWCAGMYVAAGVVLARRLAPRPWGAAAKVLALSAAAGIIASALE